MEKISVRFCPLVLENPDFGWMDDNTFKLVFDGGVDEFGDSFFYCCEYWKDVNEWHFQRVYDDDYTDAGFVAAQIYELKRYMAMLMHRSGYPQ